MKYFATKISENMHETPEGYLLCLGVSIGRTGTMDYGKGETPLEVGSNGIAKVGRSAEELFRAETIASFEGKPFTIKHPEEFVGPDNWKQLAKGVMQNVRRGKGDENEDLICDLLITDALAISLVKKGLRGLSCGYEAEYVQTGEGTGIQKNIVGNHLALVDEGRAGDSYAINDSKGDFRMSKKLGDKIKSAFSRVVDKAMDEEAKKEDKPADKSKDSSAYDELVKMCDDNFKKMKDALESMKPKDEEAPEKKEKEQKDEPDDEEGKDADVNAGLEDRLKALEAAVQKLMEGMSTDEDEDVEDDDEESEDEDAPDTITDEDGDDDESEDEVSAKLTGDEMSRAEILAPGIKKTKDIKSAALKAAYATTDGKKAIDTLTGGKKPTFDSADKVDLLFNAASELLKSSRTGKLSRAKTGDYASSILEGEGHMTAEKMNEIHAKHYSNK